MTRQLHYVNELTQNSELVHWALELGVLSLQDISLFMTHCTLEFFLNNFTEFSDKIFVITVKGLQLSTSYVRDQDATTVPARHTWETGSLNSVQFMLCDLSDSLNLLNSLNSMKILFHLEKLHCSCFQKEDGWVFAWFWMESRWIHLISWIWLFLKNYLCIVVLTLHTK